MLGTQIDHIGIGAIGGGVLVLHRHNPPCGRTTGHLQSLGEHRRTHVAHPDLAGKASLAHGHEALDLPSVGDRRVSPVKVVQVDRAQPHG